jgi:hypothetical protein
VTNARRRWPSLEAELDADLHYRIFVEPQHCFLRRC